MDYGYMGELMLSMLLFAPGLILFVALLGVGVAMILERAGVFGAMQGAAVVATTDATDVANPATGKIVSSLKEAVADSAEDAKAEGKRRTGT